MIEQNPSLVQLLKQLQQVPYLASKNLYKVLDYYLEMDQAKAQHFCKILLEVKSNLTKCPICWIWKEVKSDCGYCQSTKRDKKVICVVETWQDFIAIEKTGGYMGLYHVLGGAISPLDGIGPEDLTLDSLVRRVSPVIDENFKETVTPARAECSSEPFAEKNVSRHGVENKIEEIILAMNQTPEGEATSVYISGKLKNLNIKITCLARGIPVGYSLENMDRITVYKALSERRPF